MGCGVLSRDIPCRIRTKRSGTGARIRTKSRIRVSSKRSSGRGSLISVYVDTQAVEDAHKRRIFTPFLICNETGSPPTFNFRQSTSKTRTTCTVKIDDSTFHLFQAYMHLDIPLICRLPSCQPDNGYWAQIPINLIGKAELSHFDIEPKINFIIH